MALTKDQRTRLRYWDYVIYWLNYQIRNYRRHDDEA